MILKRAPKLKSASLVTFACTILLGAAGCAKRVQNQDLTGTVTVNADYRERHPIVLANSPRRLDIYAVHGSSGLDLRQNEDIRSFAAEYKSAGRGVLTVSVPYADSANTKNSAKTKNNAYSDIRHILASNGVPAQYIRLKYYDPQDSYSAAPIQLNFIKLQASVTSLCGQWKTDFAGAGTAENFINQPPSNFGCAYQSAIAAQVANPLDIDRPRQEGAINTEKRSQGIKSINTARDPSTQYSTTSTKIGDIK